MTGSHDANKQVKLKIGKKWKPKPNQKLDFCLFANMFCVPNFI